MALHDDGRHDDCVPDLIKKLSKSGVLDPSETTLVALQVAPGGQTQKRAAWAGGGALGYAFAKRKIKKMAVDGPDESVPGEAQRLRGFEGMLVLTPDEFVLLAVTKLGATPKEVSDRIPLRSVDRLSSKFGLAANLLDVYFTDGSGTRLDVLKSNKPQAFIDAFTAVR
jgi:hypothetical protein